MADRRITLNLSAETTAYRLGVMAAALADPRMSNVLREAAAAWQAGDRSALLLAVVAFADDLAAETNEEMTHGR